MSPRRILPLLLIVVVLAGGAKAAMIELPLEAVAIKAVDIVQGEVIAQTSDWAYGNRTIVTDVTIRVDEAFKGGLFSGDVVTVRVEGGEVDDVGIWVEHQPRFLDSERVVLFLTPDRLGIRTIQSLEQGKYTVFADQTYDYCGRRLPLQELKNRVRLQVDGTER
ncbi:MAG: hypothetical protein ABIF77_08865 [bacterium]